MKELARGHTHTHADTRTHTPNSGFRKAWCTYRQKPLACVGNSDQAECAMRCSNDSATHCPFVPPRVAHVVGTICHKARVVRRSATQNGNLVHDTRLRLNGFN